MRVTIQLILNATEMESCKFLFCFNKSIAIVNMLCEIKKHHLFENSFITKAGNEICADPNERWVQRLKNLVDARTLKETSEDSA